MKTTLFITRLIYALLFSILISTNFGCAAFMDAELNGQQTIPFTKEGLIDLNKLAELAEADQKLYTRRFYTQQFVEGSAGFGLNSIEDETETSFCFGAGYNYRISEDNYNGASYLGAFANYQSLSADELDASMLRAGLKYTYFDRITKNAEVDLTYGFKAFYETGSQEDFGFKQDVSGYGAAFTIGANFNVTDDFAIGLEVPFINYIQRTFEYEDEETKEENIRFGLNKDNMVMAYARIALGK